MIRVRSVAAAAIVAFVSCGLAFYAGLRTGEHRGSLRSAWYGTEPAIAFFGNLVEGLPSPLYIQGSKVSFIVQCEGGEVYR